MNRYLTHTYQENVFRDNTVLVLLSYNFIIKHFKTSKYTLSITLILAKSQVDKTFSIETQKLNFLINQFAKTVNTGIMHYKLQACPDLTGRKAESQNYR